MTEKGELQKIADRLQIFADERNWQQFHSPKNLAMALNVEAGELLEHFQWLTEAESAQVDETKKQEITKEIADVQIYLVRLADQLGIDILSAVEEKFRENKEKYPVDKVWGSAKKYTEY